MWLSVRHAHAQRVLLMAKPDPTKFFEITFRIEVPADWDTERAEEWITDLVDREPRTKIQDSVGFEAKEKVSL